MRGIQFFRVVKGGYAFMVSRSLSGDSFQLSIRVPA
ncbi:MAG: hypothetical protein Hyperionvirus10_63, partial [Hyperionvirus sp.]